MKIEIKRGEKVSFPRPKLKYEVEVCTWGADGDTGNEFDMLFDTREECIEFITPIIEAHFSPTLGGFRGLGLDETVEFLNNNKHLRPYWANDILYDHQYPERLDKIFVNYYDANGEKFEVNIIADGVQVP